MSEKIKIIFQDRTNRYILIALVLSSLVMVFSGRLSQAENSRSSAAEEPYSADTIIPAGFVLVPIEIQNIDSLASIIGQFGVIDLFTTPHPGQKSGVRVGRRLKLLRAPLNPQQFAVLVPENEAAPILQASGPYFAVIQNPASKEPSEYFKNKQALDRTQQVEYFKGNHK